MQTPDRGRARRTNLVAVAALVAATVGVFAATASPSSADVTTLKGSAFGYFAKVSLFGGPANLRGFGQVVCTAPNVPVGCVSAADAPSAASPSVDLPAAGGNVSQNDPDGAKAQYGPATIFGGIQLPANNTPPRSGPISVSSQGTTGPTGSVTSAADIVLYDPATPATPGGVGPLTFNAREVHSTCTASGNGVTTSTTIANGRLAINTDSNGEPATTVDIPVHPSVNYTVEGDITNVGDHFKDVFNEQVANPDGSITVNAYHEYLLGPTAVGDLVVGSSTCLVTAVAPTTTTTSAAAGTTTTTSPGGTTTTTNVPARTPGLVMTAAVPNTVTGSAFGYLAKVSLFGGPANLRGFGQAVCTSANVPVGCVPTAEASSSSSPSVTLNSAGGNESKVDADGAKAQYGPATIFGGIQLPANGTPPPSGPISVSSQGSVDPTATVTSSVDIVLYSPATPATPGGVGPTTFAANEVHSKCTANASGVTATVTIVSGKLATATDSNGEPLPDKTVDVPTNPPVNHTVEGDITNVGDHFKDVFNEQVKNPDGSTTVNAYHEYLQGPTAVGDLIIGQSVCGVNASATGGTTTTGGTGTTTGGTGSTGGGTGSTSGGTGSTGTTPSGMASTGANILPILFGGLLLVLSGSVVLLVRRRLVSP